MLNLQSKPTNVEEAINAGWKTTKEMYEAAGVGERTLRRFMADVSNATLQKQDSGCRIDPIANLVVKLGSSHKAYYHPKVEKAFRVWLRRNAINAGGQRTEGSIIKQEIHDIVDNSGYKYTKEDICSICNVGHTTFETFASQSVGERDFISVGSSHKKLYTEQVLQQFQLWLMRNQTNQGKSSEVVKQATTENLELGALAHVALTNREAWEQFKALGDAKLETEEKLKLEQQQNQQLQLENQSMRNTLQYDKVKGWYKWSDLKRDWKPHCDRLKKGNYETIFYEAGLEYGKDYEEITFSGYEFPTCMVSPTAVPKLISYLHIF